MTAFVPSAITRPTLTTSFTGTTISHRPQQTPSTPRTRHVIVSEAYSLDKYAAMSRPDTQPNTGPSEPSGIWTMYRDSLKERFSPFRAAKDTETTIGFSKAAIAAASTPYARILSITAAGSRGIGGDPDSMCTPLVGADKYMAKCVTLQYKATAVPTGVYSVRCTEGAVKGQAEEARNASLSMQFRMNHRSTSAKFADYVETRRKAFIACKGCSYEEALVTKYPASARAMVTGGSEAKGTCNRYAVGMGPEEKYMAACVDKQMKFKAVPMGVYDVMCTDGNAKNVAEYKRVVSMGARFRIGQLSQVTKEQMKFDAAKYAREYYGHGCDYEEGLFNKYPAVSISMRPSYMRY